MSYPINPTFNTLQLVAITLLLCAINVLFAYDVFLYEHHHVHGENALLENLQAFFLGLGTLLFLVPNNANAANAFLNKAFALLCFSFLLRELDMERLGLPVAIAQLGSGTGRKVLLVLLWGLLLHNYARNVHDKPGFLRSMLVSYKFKLMLVVLALLAVSTVMDKEILPVEQPRLYEELAETNAYLLMLVLSVVRLSRHAHLPHELSKPTQQAAAAPEQPALRQADSNQ